MGSDALPLPMRFAEELLGNRLGAGVYRRWVRSLGLGGHERVLDVGSGAGACARHLADALEAGGGLTCLEIDGRWLEIARRRLAGRANVEYVRGDAVTWVRPEAFDVATVHFVLHDIPAARRLDVLRNVAAGLVPGGRLFVREPVTHGMTAEEMDALLAAAGFRRIGDGVLGSVPLMGPTVSAAWEKPTA